MTRVVQNSPLRRALACIAGFAGVCLFLAPSASAAQAVCGAASIAPVTVRAESRAELLPEITIPCGLTGAIGGSGGQNFVPSGSANISVVVSTAAGRVPIRSIQVPGSTSGADTETRIFVTGSSPVPVTPGDSGVASATVSVPAISEVGYTITIRNLRIDAAAVYTSGSPVAVNVAVNLTSSVISTTTINLGNVAVLAPGLGTVALSGSPVNPWGCLGSTTSAPLFRISLTEGFALAFKAQGLASTSDPLGAQLPPVSPVVNSLPGSEFANNTETGFAVASSGGDNQANSGTRLKILFSSLPGAIRIYVPLSVVGASGQLMFLTSTETGPFQAVPASTDSTAPAGTALLTASEGRTFAIYEVASTLPTQETHLVPVYISASAGDVASASAIQNCRFAWPV